VNWYVYLPPAVSVFLLLISNLADLQLKSLVKHFNPPNLAVQKSKEVIEGVALDWATRLGFYNSMIVAFASCFSVYSGTQSYSWVVGTFIALLVIFVIGFFLINSQGAGKLAVTSTPRFFNLRYSTICNIALIIVNILLAVEIAITQSLGTSSK